MLTKKKNAFFRVDGKCTVYCLFLRSLQNARYEALAWQKYRR